MPADQNPTSDTPTPTAKKLDELYDLIDDIEIAMMTTRRPDGMLVTRPMDTQAGRDDVPGADLWFVTSIETHKTDELEADPHVSLGYYNDSTKEWVSVSGHATLSQDRELLHKLYQRDWKAWFPDEGGKKDGGPDDPRLALICVDAHSVIYMKATHSRPVQLYEITKGLITGSTPDVGRTEHLDRDELH